MSQSHLASLAQLEQGDISRLESGKKEITLNLLRKYSRAFNITLGQLLAFLEYEKNHLTLADMFRRYKQLRDIALEQQKISQEIIQGLKQQNELLEKIRRDDHRKFNDLLNQISDST
jgi:transcriptional regulator with XRE-family HTH domain